MSKSWYPVIDYELCTECGACISKCSHGVYSENKAPRPVVMFTDGCVEGCRGCASICPAYAIIYVGEHTGKPINACGCEDNDEGCEAVQCECAAGCGCGDSDDYESIAAETKEEDCGCCCGGNCGSEN
ncbi:MAG: 4Fe-4S binding protein [Clostridia bacterium]